jgi:hypothetical protein
LADKQRLDESGKRKEEQMSDILSFANSLKSKIGNAVFGQNTELKWSFDNPFPFPISQVGYVGNRLMHLYSKILRDCYSRTAGIDDKLKPLFWDTVVKSYGKSNADKGLISLLADAMANRKDLFLIYRKDVLRTADNAETQEIKEAFERGKSAKGGGFWFSFRGFEMSLILDVLLSLQFAAMSTTYTGMNASKALQLKIHQLRVLVADSEKEAPQKQAKAIVDGIKNGNSVLLDALDKVETTAVDMTSTKTSIDFIGGLIAETLNMPLYYVNGELQTGLNATGEADNSAVERGLEAFFNSIFKPVVDELFNLQVSFVSEKWRLLLSSGSALKTLESISEQIIPLRVKQKVAESVLKDFYSDEDKLSGL